MRWFLLLLLLVVDSPAWGEDVGAKAMFKNPSLDVLSFSPSGGPKPQPSQPPQPTQPPSARPGGSGGRPQGPGPAPKVEPVRSIGIRCWIQRVDDQGKILGEMGVGRVFRSGERIQLLVESNTEGYLAVVQEGADGRAGLLFPVNESEMGTHRTPAHARVVLPGPRHSFTFDDKPGTERLLVVLVRDRQELAALPLRREMSPADLAAVRRVAAAELGAKNLIVEAFADPREDPATYTVNRAGNTVVQEIALVHER